MKLPRRNFLHLAAGAAALPSVSRIAWAQAYPTRPITMIVPAPAGGPTDSITRILIEHIRSSLGQPIVIENGGGAGGTCWSRSARQSRRLHARRWQLGQFRCDRRNLLARIRSADGLRADFPVDH